MSKYAFLIGRKPLISLAELQAVLPQANFLELSSEILIVECDDITEPQKFLNQLGGTIKLIQITEQHPKNTKQIHQKLSQLVLTHFRGHQGKAKYALYVHTLRGGHEQILKSSLIETKKLLQSEGLSSRFINNNFHNAEIAHLKGEKILEKGGEFCAIESREGWLLGRTVAIQDIDNYSARDYDRPERDARIGMLPPKLAQILINLTGQNQLTQTAGGEANGKTIYDPFCGLGTVLMEGALMGFNVIGSDLVPDTLNKAEKNLDWLFQKTHTSATSPKSHLFVRDAGQISKRDLPDKPAAIVSETYLGPPMSQTPSREQIISAFGEIEETIANFFDAIGQIIDKDTPIVITLLTYRNTGLSGPRFLVMDRLLDTIREMGFVQEDLLSPELISKFSLPADSQKTLLYERPDQIVCRGIYKFKLA